MLKLIIIIVLFLLFTSFLNYLKERQDYLKGEIEGANELWEYFIDNPILNFGEINLIFGFDQGKLDKLINLFNLNSKKEFIKLYKNDD